MCIRDRDMLVGLELLVLGGEGGGVQIEELAAEQADAAAVVDLHGVDVLGRADVAVDADGLAVLGQVGLALQGLQQALQALLLLTLLQQAVAGVVIGVDDQCAGAAVGDGLAAFVLRLEAVSYTHLDVYKRQAKARAGRCQTTRFWGG